MSIETTPVKLQVRVARGFIARARGLLGRPPPAPGCGLLLPGVTSVHGFGMRHHIDLLFFDGQGVIVQVASLAPAAIAGCREAQHVLEMRSGEIVRLGLRPVMRPLLLLLDDIFGDGAEGAEPADSSSDVRASSGSGLRSIAFMVCFLIASGLASDGARAAPPEELAEGGGTATRTRVEAKPGVFVGAGSGAATANADFAGKRDRASAPGRAVPVQLLRLLEEQAEAIYKEGGQDSDSRELVEVYETLAELAADRSAHAWLRIGNIRQRAGSVGEAIDAYRRVHAPVDARRDAAGPGAGLEARSGAPSPGGKVAATTAGPAAGTTAGTPAWTVAGWLRRPAPAPATSSPTPAEVRAAIAAERKALLNLTALALEQARLSLARLDSLPPATNADVPGGEPAAAATSAGADRAAVAALRRQLENAAQGQAEQQRRLAEASAPRGPASRSNGAQLVERYTASARRNAVTSARGSLHVDPADELPAQPVPKPRSIPATGYLPSVEYLLGDPLRSRQQPAGEGDNPGIGGSPTKAKATAGTSRKRGADEAGGDAGERSGNLGRERALN